MTLARRLRVVFAGLLVVTGCAGARSYVVAAPAGVPPRAVPRSSPAATTAPPTTAAPAPASTTTATTAPPAPASTTPPATTPPAPAIATHDARLGALPADDGPVPVAVEAGASSAISGPVVPAGVDPTTGELAIPAQAAVVAWYQFGPAPGRAGSAVLAGHVDWHGVPGIFFTLRKLQPGDPVSVAMSDGSVLNFHVVATRMVDKPELPNTDVFTRSGDPTLTLVTCGGQFDSSTHHYLSNVVVTALPD